MSYEAIRWAMSQPVDKSAAKFVLVAMADCVNNEGEQMLCWPSHKHLTERTGQDVKTVEAGLRRLRDAGFITDTNQRKGATGRVVIWRLKAPEIGGIGQASNTPVFPVNTPVFPIQYPQISHPIPPFLGDGTSKEPVKEPVRNQEDARLTAIPPSLVADYLKLRKAKRAGPFTETAIDGMEREAIKAGLTLENAMRACCEFAWQGFNAGWYLDRIGRSNTPRDRRSVQARTINELTGGLASVKEPQHASTPIAITR